MANRVLVFTILTSCLIGLTFAMCGRRGSPAYRIVENIIDNATDRDRAVLRCFISRMIRVQTNGEEETLQPSLFLNCVLHEIGAGTEDRRVGPELDEIIMDYIARADDTGKSGLPGLKPCLYQKLSCPEVHSMVICRQAMDDVYNNRTPQPDIDKRLIT